MGTFPPRRFSAVRLSVIHAFPGTGRDYPIYAGEAEVVAWNSTNHAMTTNQFDLSVAHFEQHGSEPSALSDFAALSVKARRAAKTAGLHLPGQGPKGGSIRSVHRIDVGALTLRLGESGPYAQRCVGDRRRVSPLRAARVIAIFTSSGCLETAATFTTS